VKVSKSGNQYAMVELEDITGSIEISFFGEAFLKFGPALKADAIISVVGKIQRRDEVASIRASEMSIPDVSVLESAPLSLTLVPNRLNEATLSRLKNVLNNHQGTSPVRLVVVENGKKTTVQAGDNYRVNKTPALYSDVKAILGMNCLERTLVNA
jgi:DNA polymerase-3 subunit alpha